MKHFETLATPADCDHYEESFYELCKTDYDTINKITKDCERKQVSELQINSALKQMHKGKSEDCFGLAAENLFYASDNFKGFLTVLINQIFAKQRIPELLKTGLLTPLYKNKGERKDAKNYRGITVLPIVLKLIEHLRDDLKGTSRQRSGKGAIRKRFPLQKQRWEKTKLTIRYIYHETNRKPNEQLFSQ